VSLLTDPGFVRPNIRQTVLTPYYQEVDSDPINDILHVWQRGGLVEDALVRSDRLSAHSQIQLHFPMLNRRLIEYCEQLPGDYKVRKQRLEYISKYPLRMSMKNRLPKRLLRRPKRTWLNPLDHWLRHDGRPFLHAQITEICQEDSYLFVPEHLQKLYREHVNKVANHGLKLWTLILFHLWWKTI
jgi:asparagine synthase (glutamine-hydrolysing)